MQWMKTAHCEIINDKGESMWTREGGRGGGGGIERIDKSEHMCIIWKGLPLLTHTVLNIGTLLG